MDLRCLAATAFSVGILLCPPDARGQTITAPPAAAPDEPAPAEVLPGTPPSVATTPQQRATLGLTVAPVTEDAVRQLGLIVQQGALITGLLPGSPADRVGLPLGGVIVSLDGQRIDSPKDLAAVVGAARPGQKVELRYYERNRQFRKTVQLAPTNAPPRTIPSQPAPALDRPRPDRARRPVLKGIDRLIDELLPPGTLPPVIPPPPAASPDAIAALKVQVEQLQRQVAQLQQKVDELERKLDSDRSRTDR